ncbi:hypothetical protein VZT92_023198 [Zoarces viviparus]|uniref:Uncharacterized protein n=1 Tax=Zoarces viviparus TaxID=48416 RepID=A0AAW1E5W8_ZOAVI
MPGIEKGLRVAVELPQPERPARDCQQCIPTQRACLPPDSYSNNRVCLELLPNKTAGVVVRADGVNLLHHTTRGVFLDAWP